MIESRGSHFPVEPLVFKIKTDGIKQSRSYLESDQGVFKVAHPAA